MFKKNVLVGIVVIVVGLLITSCNPQPIKGWDEVKGTQICDNIKILEGDIDYFEVNNLKTWIDFFNLSDNGKYYVIRVEEPPDGSIGMTARVKDPKKNNQLTKSVWIWINPLAVNEPGGMYGTLIGELEHGAQAARKDYDNLQELWRESDSLGYDWVITSYLFYNCEDYSCYKKELEKAANNWNLLKIPVDIQIYDKMMELKEKNPIK